MCNRTINVSALTLPVIFCSLITTNAHSDINQWPKQNQLDTSAFEKRFIEVFSNSPEDVPEMDGMVKCGLDENRARQFTNLTEEIQENMMKGGASTSSSITSVDVTLDIDRLDHFSTAKGCNKLKNTAPEKIKYGHMQLFRAPLTITEPLKTHVEYEQEITMAMNIAGQSTETETEYEHESQSIRRWPTQPVHPDFPIEVISISSNNKMDDPSYSILFTGNKKQDGSTTRISLTSMKISGETHNSITIMNNDGKGHSVQSTYGKNMRMAMVDGKLHGLMTTENYLYKTDKSQNPWSYSCYNMGEKVNVFKITGDVDCKTVSEDLIGSAGVHVDAIYKMQLSLKGVTVNKPTPSQQAKLTKQKKISAQFTQLQSSAKCKLSNTDWAYTGKECKNGLAHGKGKAEDRQGLKFIGMFEAGQRVKGEIHQHGNMIFSGDLVDDKPEGNAICFHEGEYEECRFFKGKRIDALYKIRKETAKLQQKTAQMQQSQSVSSTSSRQKGVGDYAVDALKREGASRAADFIFDSLF